MTDCLTNLAELLEQESAVGEELCRNLAAQKRALAAWNIEELLRQIDAREPWLRLLGDLEARREAILRQNEFFSDAPTLRQVIARLSPEELALKTRLAALRERNRHIFTRLQSDEKDLYAVMENLSGYIQEALCPLLKPSVPTYNGNGASEQQRPTASAFLKGQA